MRCQKCRKEIPNGSKFCGYCGASFSVNFESQLAEAYIEMKGCQPRRERKKRTWSIVAIFVLLLCILGCFAFYKVFIEGSAREAALEIQENGYEFKETVISETDAPSSEDVPTVSDLSDELTLRGFEGVSIVSNYDMEGEFLSEEKELDPLSKGKHPLYNVFYTTPQGDIWVIYVCNGVFMANPLFMYEFPGVQTLLIEGGHVVSYDANADLFIEADPDESEVVVKQVDKIDKATLDSLGVDEIEAL